MIAHFQPICCYQQSECQAVPCKQSRAVCPFQPCISTSSSSVLFEILHTCNKMYQHIYPSKFQSLTRISLYQLFKEQPLMFEQRDSLDCSFTMGSKMQEVQSNQTFLEINNAFRKKLEETKKEEERKKALISNMDISYAHLVKFLKSKGSNGGPVKYSAKNQLLKSIILCNQHGIKEVDAKLQEIDTQMVQIVNSNNLRQNIANQLSSQLTNLQSCNSELLNLSSSLRETNKHKEAYALQSKLTMLAKSDLDRLKDKVNKMRNKHRKIVVKRMKIANMNRILKNLLIQQQNERTLFYNDCLSKCNQMQAKPHNEDKPSFIFIAIYNRFLKLNGITHKCQDILRLKELFSKN